MKELGALIVKPVKYLSSEFSALSTLRDEIAALYKDKISYMHCHAKIIEMYLLEN
jgi:hypothetical protein